jgi:hypothetical protein
VPGHNLLIRMGTSRKTTKEKKIKKRIGDSGDAERHALLTATARSTMMCWMPLAGRFVLGGKGVCKKSTVPGRKMSCAVSGENVGECVRLDGRGWDPGVPF